MNELTKSGNVITWKVQISKDYQVMQESSIFEIQYSRCCFLFYTGHKYRPKNDMPLSLSIFFVNSSPFTLIRPIDITRRVILPSETVSLPRQTITGKFQQMIWSSFDYGLIGSLLTFKMIIHDPGMTGADECFSCKKSVETEFVSFHKKCIDRPVKCPDCSRVFLLQDWLRGHECQKKKDKALQTPSYLNNYFLMEGIAQEFSKVLVRNSDQDVEFIIGDQTIKAHKKVLICCSDVFTSMLQSDMIEGRTGRVNIKDMDAKHFREFLKYLYTGVLPTLTVDTAMNFYEAGDKYNVSSLKKQCVDFLLDYLSPENVYDILIFADRHSDADIKKGAKDFIVKEKMPDSGEKWAEFCKQYPMLAVEVYRLFNKHLLPNE